MSYGKRAEATRKIVVGEEGTVKKQTILAGLVQHQLRYYKAVIVLMKLARTVEWRCVAMRMC